VQQDQQLSTALEQQQSQVDEQNQQQQQQQQLQLQLQQKPAQQLQQSESVQSHLQQQQAKDQQLEEQPAAKQQAQLSADSWEQLMDHQTAAFSASSPEPLPGVEATGGQAADDRPRSEDSAPSPSTVEQEEEQLEDLEQAANEEEEEDNCAAAKRCAPLFSRTTLLPGMIPLSGLMNLGNAAQIAKSIPAELAGGPAAFPALPLSRNSSRYQ